MKRSFLLLNISLATLVLTGCEHVKHAKSYEKDSKSGLFTGEKGYFEAVPGGAKTQKEFEEAPGLLSGEGGSPKTGVSSSSDSSSLEAQAAS